MYDINNDEELEQLVEGIYKRTAKKWAIRGGVAGAVAGGALAVHQNADDLDSVANKYSAIARNIPHSNDYVRKGLRGELHTRGDGYYTEKDKENDFSDNRDERDAILKKGGITILAGGAIGALAGGAMGLLKSAMGVRKIRSSFRSAYEKKVISKDEYTKILNQISIYVNSDDEQTSNKAKSNLAQYSKKVEDRLKKIDDDLKKIKKQDELNKELSR